LGEINKGGKKGRKKSEMGQPGLGGSKGIDPWKLALISRIPTGRSQKSGDDAVANGLQKGTGGALEAVKGKKSQGKKKIPWDGGRSSTSRGHRRTVWKKSRGNTNGRIHRLFLKQ